MKLRSGLPAALAIASMAIFTGCEDDNRPPSPFEPFLSFSILAEVTNIGPGGDADGFVISIDPSATSERVGAGEVLRLDQDKGGTWTVTLSDVAGNCTIVDGDTRSIRVRDRDQRTLARRADFTVECN